ncbi:methyltransferase domain-containing protein [Streptomyces varsoviensis]|uniref:methyltransferase domain-containing protein n=1 Tax=Streptomyces varsoviensis TaxID=67373 RepID=UPI0004C9031B|nr:methyltransferase domain-containing protein [Streptomyces varsoviensis]
MRRSPWDVFDPIFFFRPILPTSSSDLFLLERTSMRSVRDAIDSAPDGGSVLLVGSGNGELLLRLAERVGAEGRVMGVDVDPVKVESARELVARSRLGHVHSAAADGWYGWRENAPHDLVLSTVAVPSLPPSWVTQSRPGALICAPVQWGGEAGPAFFATFRVESRHEVSLVAAVPERYNGLCRNWARMAARTANDLDGAEAACSDPDSADHPADIELREALMALGRRRNRGGRQP